MTKILEAEPILLANNIDEVPKHLPSQSTGEAGPDKPYVRLTFQACAELGREVVRSIFSPTI